MSDNTIKQVKKLELKILKYVQQVCENNNIKYYLIGGTLLGAVRHKGFIPWDDDIDIVMFRDDYNRFIELMNDDIEDGFFMQNFRTEPMYTRYITKIRLDGTKFLERSLDNYPIHHGIFIDIFPLDKISYKNQKKIDRRVQFANKILAARMIKNGQLNMSNKNKSLVFSIIKPLVKIIPLRVYSDLIDWIYCYDNKKKCEYVTNFSSQYGWRKQTFPIDVYGEGTYLEFEGHQFMAPAKWEVILKSLYGDYMQLPPEEKQNSGHDVVHIDLGKYAEN